MLLAAELVGLLADPARLRVVAALALGADSLDTVRTVTGLDARASTRAVTRLVDAGLVERDTQGGLVLLEAAFALAARSEAARRAAHDPSVAEHPDAGREEAKVLRTFVRNERIVQIPAQHQKRLIVLDWLAQQFEPGRRYTEAMVNLVIGRIHPDTAALRRYLVDDGFLDRDHGEYWRIGGRVEP
jgi:hypothetical protein